MFFQNEIINYTVIITLLIIISLIISKILKFVLGKILTNNIDQIKSDPTNYKFLNNAITFIVFLIVIFVTFYSIPALKQIGLTLLASAGIFAAILGFAAQAAFSNIISGIFIVIFKPFRVGDLIEIADRRGVVEDITLRHTVIRNVENRRSIIPNSVISNETILNASIVDTKICNLFEVGISYDSNIDDAIKIVQERAIEHPNCIDVRTKEQKDNGESVVTVKVLGYGESSVNLRAYIWSIDSLSGFNMKCDLYKSIKEEFDKNNIEIPFPYRTIVYKNKSDKNENIS